MRDEARFKEVAITHEFFINFPGGEEEEVAVTNLKVNAMLQACKDMYNLARTAESITLLQKARTMKDQLTEIFGALQMKHEQSQSGLITPGGMPASMDAGAWLK